MSVIARFEIIPVREGSMSTAIAQALRALDNHPVSYQTTPTDTIIEAESVEQVFAAVQAAHQAIPEDRVITSVEIDEDRRRPQTMSQRVESVERALGHPPQRYQQPAGQPAQAQTSQMQPPPQQAQMPPQPQPSPQTGMPPQGQQPGQFQGQPPGQQQGQPPQQPPGQPYGPTR